MQGLKVLKNTFMRKKLFKIKASLFISGTTHIIIRNIATHGYLNKGKALLKYP